MITEIAEHDYGDSRKRLQRFAKMTTEIPEIDYRDSSK